MKTIGRSDKADFPELHLEDIGIKIDTGAYTSSIHSHEIRTVEEDGVAYLEFKILDPSYKKFKDKLFKAKSFKEKKIKNSFGSAEKRYIIKTIIEIHGKEYPIELSLSERSNMKFPILIGRRFLNRRFVVNTTLKNISFDLKQKNKNNPK